MQPILVYDDEAFLRHAVPEGHPENPGRVIAARAALEAFEKGGKGELVRRVAPLASEESILLAHSEQHFLRMKHLEGRSKKLDEDTWMSPGTYEAALRAAGGAEALALSLVAGDARFGLSLGRPPGHHAGVSSPMGFCVFNNVAIAALSALRGGAGKVAIVDWDAHHGNGTQAIFSDDPTVLFISVHNHMAWPYTGLVRDVGSGGGIGASVNVSLPAKSGDAAFTEAFRRIVCPALVEFSPSLLLVSAGFDAHRDDPIGGFSVTESGYSKMASMLASCLPDVPIGLVLEGGYDLRGLSSSLSAALTGLSVKDDDWVEDATPEQEGAIKMATAVHSQYRRLS